MPIVKRLTIENVNLDDECEMDEFDDQVITAGMERVRAEGDELRVGIARCTRKPAAEPAPQPSEPRKGGDPDLNVDWFVQV